MTPLVQIDDAPECVGFYITRETVSDMLKALDGNLDMPEVLRLHAGLRDLLLGEG